MASMHMCPTLECMPMCAFVSAHAYTHACVKFNSLFVFDVYVVSRQCLAEFLHECILRVQLIATHPWQIRFKCKRSTARIPRFAWLSRMGFLSVPTVALYLVVSLTANCWLISREVARFFVPTPVCPSVVPTVAENKLCLEKFEAAVRFTGVLEVALAITLSLGLVLSIVLCCFWPRKSVVPGNSAGTVNTTAGHIASPQSNYVPPSSGSVSTLLVCA